ncbi:MAG: CoA-binding protein [Sulfurovum sp.]|nr:CoA-binding protein [Sulfurovum sp.]
MEYKSPIVSSNKQEIKEIFNSIKTIAILGLSPNLNKPSYRVAKYLQEVGYRIVPVYPKEDEILGEKVYRSLIEIPFEIDMVNVFRKPAVFDAIVDACIMRGDIKVFWGQQGLVNNTAAKRAKNKGMKVVQNLCAMIEYHHM